MAFKLSFHQRHPVVSGFFILGLLLILFLGASNFLIRSCTSSFSERRGFVAVREEVIGVLDVKGMITTPDEVLEDLAKLRGNERVKGIVVRIDSPGGAVGASQEIFREIDYSSEEKPVVASMGSVAASGGYYAALGAREIVASRGTLTGSIGVILKFPNLQELYKKIGYKSQIVKSGNLKDIGSTDRPLSAQERELLNHLLDNVHQQFIKDVSRKRDLALAKVENLADGRIFSGEQALDAGLIDKTGNFYDAVRLCARMAGMKAESPNLFYPRKDKLDLLKVLTRDNLENVLGMLKRTTPILSTELLTERYTR